MFPIACRVLPRVALNYRAALGTPWPLSIYYMGVSEKRGP